MAQEKTEKTRRGKFQMEGTPSGEGSVFEILAITAGEGNGWQFDSEVLREALPLFEQTQCYIDHLTGQNDSGHSVRDLAGVLSAPRCDEAVCGIRCLLKPFGPAKALLIETGQQVLQDSRKSGTNARVGFSADLAFTYQGKRVTRILRIYSVDLVTEPARGGVFLKQAERQQHSAGVAPQSVLRESFSETVEDQPTDALLADLGLRTCASLLDSALSAAQLPPALQQPIREQFAGRTFDPDELERALTSQKRLYSALCRDSSVSGIHADTLRVEQMVSETDQIGAAVHDLLGAERPQDLARVKTQRLSGIRELYTLMTGDYAFHGGFHPERAAFARTADLPAVLKNALNKLIAQRWEELGRSGYRWWEPLVTVEHFNNLQSISGILVGEIGLLPSVSEGAAYTELGVTDSAESGTWEKYGGYLGLTIEMFERDETLRLRQFPLKLATAGLRRLSALVGGIFTASEGAGPLMSDGKHVFDAAAHRNLGSTALSSESWESASSAIYNQPLLVKNGETAPIQAVDARYLVVPRALRLAAQRILYPSFAWESGYTSENQQRGLSGDVITCPEMSDPNDWVAVADPKVAPAIYIGERFGLLPEIYIADNQQNGALFTNDEVRIKARHFLSVFVADHRPLYKSNVANA